MVYQLRILALTCSQPVHIRAKFFRENISVNTPVNHADTVWRNSGIIIQHVVTRTFGDGYHPFTFRHHGTVGIHGIQAMDSRDKTRAIARIHTPPGQPGYPGWQPGTGM